MDCTASYENDSHYICGVCSSRSVWPSVQSDLRAKYSVLFFKKINKINVMSHTKNGFRMYAGSVAPEQPVSSSQSDLRDTLPADNSIISHLK